jgi:predicted nucleic acid-binding protein
MTSGPTILRPPAAMTAASLALVGHRQITDAYVLALAPYHKGALATFDGGIAALISAARDRARYATVLDLQ